MSKKKETVYLVDGSAVFYRAHFAFIRNPLINSKGENTSATFGYVNSLVKLIKDEQPDYLAVVFDTAEPTFRHKMYDDYKATREKMPDELAEQIPRIHEVTDALNIARFAMPGYEADDVIGTIAKQAAEEGYEVWCVTGDKDYFQLVDDNIGVYYPPRVPSAAPIKMKQEEVKEKFGVYPELVIDKLALMGDSSDNIPGIPGIGPKTADSLLEQFGSLDAILAGHEEIKAKGVRNKVATNGEMALLSKKLVTIATDVPVECDLSKLKRQDVDIPTTKKLFAQLEFNRLLKEVLPEGESAADAEEVVDDKASDKVDYKTITSLPDLKKLITKLKSVKEFAIDTETTSLNSLEAELVGISISFNVGTGYYLPVGHTEDSDKNLPFDQTIKLLKPILKDKKIQKFGQNLKYDLEVLHRYDIDIEPVSFDTMLASYVIDPSPRQHSLDYMAMKHFDHRMQPISELIGSGKKQKTFDTVPIDKAGYYAAEDADFTYRLRAVLAPAIDDAEMNNLYYNIELPLVKVLARVEEAGIKVDTDYLAELSADMEKRLDKLIKKIHKIAGGEFNINSTQQLSHILFDKLGLPTKGMTTKKTGYSTDQKVLESLAELHEFPKLILDYRQLTKLKSTYIDAIPKLVSGTTGRVHTSFNQTIAATGRLSSTEPNLQNIPIRTEEGREIRKAFIPADKDHVLLAADYSQIELRILAHYADDPGLIAAFKNKEDIHARTAAEVYEIELHQVTPEMRRAAKTANFAVIYGVSAFGLAQQSELDLDGAKHFIDTYFERYPGIREYMDKTKEFARRKGYVTTLFNRRRYIADINNKNYNVRQFAERTAINTPIQGTAADMIKMAMIKIDKKMTTLRSKMVLQVHDELVFDVYKDELDEVKKIVRQGMEKVVKLKVPIVVDLGVGQNWLDTK